PFFLVRHEALVRNLQQRTGWQYRAPVSEQTLMLAVVMRQVGEIQGEVQRGGEGLEVAREARVDRITSHVNYAGVGEYGEYDSQIIRIDGRLVDDAGGLRRMRLQGAQIFLCKLLSGRLIEQAASHTSLVPAHDRAPEVELSGTGNLGMRSENLLRERGTRAHHANHENGSP